MSRKKLSIDQNSRKNSQRCVQKYDTTSLRLRIIIKVSISIKTAPQRSQKIRTFSHFSTLRGCFRERIDQCQGKTSRSTYIKNKILIVLKNMILQVCVCSVMKIYTFLKTAVQSDTLLCKTCINAQPHWSKSAYLSLSLSLSSDPSSESTPLKNV